MITIPSEFSLFPRCDGKMFSSFDVAELSDRGGETRSGGEV
jgi:hypothetical protein